MGVSAGQLSHPNSLSIKRSFILQEQGIQSTQLSPIKEVLERLPQPRESLMCLKMDISLIATHAHIPVGGRLALFSHNWHCLTQDPWVLTVVQGYQLPLSQWPRRNIMESKLHLDQVQGKALQAEITGLIAKGAVVPACKSQVHLLSPLCSAKKWRGLASNNRPHQYIKPPHFKMEGLYMLPTVVQKDFFMAKVNLKDAYLTVPVAAEFHCLLTFQDERKISAVSNTAIRALHRSTCIYKTDKTRNSVSASDRYSHNYLSR